MSDDARERQHPDDDAFEQQLREPVDRGAAIREGRQLTAELKRRRPELFTPA